MKIYIDDSRKLADIQKEFNDFFPFLSLDFFSKDSDFSHPDAKRIKYLDGMTAGSCRTMKGAGTLIIFPEMAVDDLEKIFKEHFGLSVQVLRRSGNVWLKTSHTNDWSLTQQNRQGGLLSEFLGKNRKID